MSTFAKTVAIVLVVVVTSVATFVYRMGRHDTQALRDFAISYEQFDRTVMELALPSQGSGARSEQAANVALADFQAKASMKISSLRANDGTMMRAARDVSQVATQELSTLTAYRAAATKGSHTARVLAAELANVHNERRNTYARFQFLQTAPPNSPY